MGTNYYLKRIPTMEDAVNVYRTMMEGSYKNGGKDTLSPTSVNDAVNYLTELNTEIHIGKYSAGWKFCFREHTDLYESTQDSVFSFIKSKLDSGKWQLVNDNLSSINTYEEFKKIVIETQYKRDNINYCKVNPGIHSWEKEAILRTEHLAPDNSWWCNVEFS